MEEPMQRPTDAPWPIEEVYPRDLVVDDVVKWNGNFPWLRVARIVDAGPNQPDWEKQMGSRGFVLEPLDGEGPNTVGYDNHNVRQVWRRVR